MCVCLCESELLATDEVHKCVRESEREKTSADVWFTNESMFWNGYTFEYHMTLRTHWHNVSYLKTVMKVLKNGYVLLPIGWLLHSTDVFLYNDDKILHSALLCNSTCSDKNIISLQILKNVD